MSVWGKYSPLQAFWQQILAPWVVRVGLQNYGHFPERAFLIAAIPLVSPSTRLLFSIALNISWWFFRENEIDVKTIYGVHCIDKVLFFTALQFGFSNLNTGTLLVKFS